MIADVLAPDAWSARARCADASEIMFGDDTELAKSVCNGCPVRRKCLDYALDGELDFGVWGGTTFDERVRICPVCHGSKEPSALGCSRVHSLWRLARLVEQEQNGDPTVSVSHRAIVSAPTSPACVIPRGRSHSSGKAYRLGCRCEASREARERERVQRTPAIPREPAEPLARFMARIEIDSDGHWMWQGGVNGSGYGNFWLDGRTVRAHRFAWHLFVGVIPPRTRLTPAPDEPDLCVNPDHFILAGR